MTPRINEDWFTQALLGRLKQKSSTYALDGRGPVSSLTHPALLKVEHAFKHDRSSLEFRSHSSDYNLQAFQEKSLAPSIQSYGGFPHDIYRFLRDKPDEAVLDFGDLGSVLLSKTESFAPAFVPELHHYTLPLWVDYALSPELWGPAGKWTRFHEPLHKLFREHALLVDQDSPGFYPLSIDSSWLRDHGFHGLVTPTAFQLILTWDFPLTALRELEDVLARRP